MGDRVLINIDWYYTTHWGTTQWFQLIDDPWTSGRRRACMVGRRATAEVALDPAAPTGIAGGAYGVRAPWFP